MFRWRSCWAVLCFVFITAPGLGQEKCPPASWVQVVELSRDAKGLLDNKQFDEALTVLRAAYGICPEPVLQRSIARVHEEADRLEEAFSSFQACAADAQDEALRSECDQRANALGEKLATATLVVETGSPDAVMTLDEGAPSPCGGAIEVKPGRHRLEVQADGCLPYLAEIDVRGGRENRIPVVLMVAPPPPEPVESAGPERDGAGLAAPGSGPESVVAAGPAPTPETGWNWAGLGTSAAVLGVGVAFSVQYAIDKSNAQPERWDPELQGWWAADTVGPRNLILGLSFAAAGVAGGLASILLWPDAPVQAGVSPTSGGGVMSLSIGIPGL